MICADFNELTVPKELTGPNWEKALLWLKSGSWKTMPEGKQPIDGQRVYASRTKYRAKPYGACRYETHRRYADIQFVINGKELMEVCSRDATSVTDDYNAEKDIEFRGGSPDEVHAVVLSYPTAVILFPKDAHKPCIALDDSNGAAGGEVEKILVKVEL